MAGEDITILDLGNLLTSMPGISTVIKLSKVALVVVIVYIAFLILKTLLGFQNSRMFKEIADNVADINRKMNTLLKERRK